MKLLIILILGMGFIITSCGNLPKTDDKNSTSQQTNLKVKVEAFNDINKTRTALSQNGIGDLTEWKDQGGGHFSSISTYFSFGSSSSNGLQNNLAYYLESDSEDCIKTLQLVLSLNNKAEKKQASSKFKELIEATFNSLSLEYPKELTESIRKAKPFQTENENFKTALKITKDSIDTWILTIETK